MLIQTKRNYHTGAFQVVVIGRFTLEVWAQFREAIMRCERYTAHIEVDLRKVEYVDSDVLSSLMVLFGDHPDIISRIFVTRGSVVAATMAIAAIPKHLGIEAA